MKANQRSKPELRHFYRGLVREAAGSPGGNPFIARELAELNQRLIDFLSPQSGYWAAFQPTGFEPDIRPALAALSAPLSQPQQPQSSQSSQPSLQPPHSPRAMKDEGMHWVFPRVEGQGMSFYHPLPGSMMTLSRWGILEPDPLHSRRVGLDEIRGLLIPGLAFDLLCNRLGRGGGFYDRALAELEAIRTNAIKIGVALDRQISDEPFPVEPFDVPMDWVVTESRCIPREGVERKSS